MTKTARGFTFIETILVISIMAIIGLATIPVGAGFLNRNNLKTKTQEVAGSLRKARLNAMVAKEDSNWGVSITGSQIILFKGSSYATRDPNFDQIYDIPASISVSSLEIIFSKLTGNPTSTPSIVLSSGGSSNTISINQVGAVDVN